MGRRVGLFDFPRSTSYRGRQSASHGNNPIQYFRTTITEEQREEFGRLVDDTVRRIESAQFLQHSGVRFPQNPCTSCAYIGFCLGRQELVDATLVRLPGDDLGLFDELTY